MKNNSKLICTNEICKRMQNEKIQVHKTQFKSNRKPEKKEIQKERATQNIN